MRSVFCCFLLSFSPAIAPCADETPVGDLLFSTVTLVLHLEAESSTDSDALDAMQNELDEVFRPAGIRFESRLADELTRSESFATVAVVHFKGSCGVNGGTAAFLPGPLGWAHATDGEILPFIGVDCSRVYGLVSTELQQDKSPQRSRKFGRALARVVAHEMYHVLTKTRQHAKRGIAKSAYTAKDLLVERLVFDQQQAEKILKPVDPRRRERSRR
jgi:hypothetical protein